MCGHNIQTMYSILLILQVFYSLEESGGTALGSALIISIAMAARVPGSQVS